MPRFPKGSQEAKDYMASIRAKRGSGVSGSKGEDETKPLIARPSQLKDTDAVREQLQKNRYIIAGEVEKALKEKKITKADRDSLLSVLETPYLSGDKDVNKIADSQSEAFMGLMERTAKKGSGMGSCPKGKEVCSCNSGGSLVGASAPPPPPPPPPRPSLPPPIDTSFSINQTLINAIEEILMSSSLPEERKAQLTAELKRLKDKVNDAGVAKASTAKPSGAGMKGSGNKKTKIAPAIPTASVELVGPPMASSRVIPVGEEDDGVPFIPDDLDFQEVTEREYPKVQETIDERYLFYRPKIDKQINMIQGQIDALQNGIKRIDKEISFNRRYSFGGEDNYGESDFIYKKKQLSIAYMNEIDKLKKQIVEIEDNAMFLNPENRELLELSPSEFSHYRNALFPVKNITDSLIRPSTKLERAKSILFKPTIARIDDIANQFNPSKPDTEPMFNPNDIGRREAERVAEEERRREMAELRTMRGYDENMSGSGISPNYVVQSVIFKKEKFSVSQAKKWLKDHKYKVVKVDKTPTMLRFRQVPPIDVEKQGLTVYRTKPLGDSGVDLVIAYQKN